MNNSVLLGYQDALLSQILAAPNPAGSLFEAYRICADKEAFVAALIGRLCVLEAQKQVCQQKASHGAISRHAPRPDIFGQSLQSTPPYPLRVEGFGAQAQMEASHA